MGKVIHASVQTSIDSRRFSGVLLAKMHFSPVQRFTNAAQNIYWDEDGGGDQEYVGVGNLASISVLTESGELQAQTVQLGISGIPNSAITDAFSTEYINKPLYVWYATLNKSTYAVEGGQTGPVLIFAGRMDYCNIEFGDTAAITVNATSRLADWERARGGRFNQTYQQRYVDATDAGFDYVQALQNKPINWGGMTLGGGGSGGGGRDGNEGGRYRLR
jgi:hypothetical protein